LGNISRLSKELAASVFRKAQEESTLLYYTENNLKREAENSSATSLFTNRRGAMFHKP
jgi:hypothetical protein